MASANPYINQTDDELLLTYRQSKDNKWLGILLQRYTILLFGVAMKYLKDKTEAEDAVQQVFLKTLTSFPAGDIQNFKGWVYIIMRNHCLQELRHETRHAGEEMMSTIADKDEVEDAVWKDYTLSQLEEALLGLNTEQQTCLKAFYIDKHTYQRIMERTGFTFIQVKSYIQNGKRNLKTILLKKLAGYNK